jgi:hypothetical protein
MVTDASIVYNKRIFLVRSRIYETLVYRAVMIRHKLNIYTVLYAVIFISHAIWNEVLHF